MKFYSLPVEPVISDYAYANCPGFMKLLLNSLTHVSMHSNSSTNRNRHDANNHNYEHSRRFSWQEGSERHHLLLAPFVPLFPFFHADSPGAIDDSFITIRHNDHQRNDNRDSPPIRDSEGHDDLLLFITELTNQDSDPNLIGRSSHFYHENRSIQFYPSYLDHYSSSFPFHNINSSFIIESSLSLSLMDNNNSTFSSQLSDSSSPSLPLSASNNSAIDPSLHHSSTLPLAIKADAKKAIWLPLRTIYIDDDNKIEQFDKILNHTNNNNSSSSTTFTTNFNSFVSKKIKNIMIKLTHFKHLTNDVKSCPYSNSSSSSFISSSSPPFPSPLSFSESINDHHNFRADGERKINFIESRIVPMTITSLVIKTPPNARNPLKNGFLFISRDENVDNEIFKPFEDYDYNALIQQYNNFNIRDRGENASTSGNHSNHNHENENEREGIEEHNDILASSPLITSTTSFSRSAVPPLPQLPSSILAVLYFQLDKNQPNFSYTFKWPVRNAKEIIVKMLSGQLPQLEYDLGYGSRNEMSSSSNRLGIEVEFIGLKGIEEPQSCMSSSFL